MSRLSKGLRKVKKKQRVQKQTSIIIFIMVATSMCNGRFSITFIILDGDNC